MVTCILIKLLWPQALYQPFLDSGLLACAIGRTNVTATPAGEHELLAAAASTLSSTASSLFILEPFTNWKLDFFKKCLQKCGPEGT